MKILFIVSGLLFLVSGCNTSVAPIEYGKDVCTFCQMTMMDRKFGAELVNNKGKTLKFDSDECMLSYLKVNKQFSAAKYLVVDYANPGVMLNAEQATFLHDGKIESPMGGKLAAFSDAESAKKFQQELNAEIITWREARELSF